jgi:flagellar hook-associated protein 2
MATSSVSGLASGIDWTDIISQLMEIKRRPITRLEAQKSDYQSKVSVWQSINTSLLAFMTEADSLKTATNFLLKTATSSDEDILTATASSSAIAGTHTVKVNRLAQNHKLAAQGWDDTDTTGVYSGGGSGTFTYSVGSGSPVSITVDSNTTLADFKDAINAAGGGLTASILNDGTPTSPYRLVLTADQPGEQNDITISDNDTDLNFSTNSIEDAYADPDNQWGGSVDSSGTYTGTMNKTYLVEITTGGPRQQAMFKVSEDGGFTWGSDDFFSADNKVEIYDDLNSTAQGAEIKFTGSGTFAVGDRFTIDVFNPTLEAAQDASIVVDNISMTKDTNTITDVIEGVTLNLLSADSSETVTVTVSNDTGGGKTAITDFVDAYNSAITLIDQQFQYDRSTDTAGTLMGDVTLRSIQQQLRSIISTSITGLTGDYVVLSQIGIRTGTDGLLSIDDTELDQALADDFVGVSKIFVSDGRTTDGRFLYLSYSDKTQAGTYDIRIQSGDLQFGLDGTWYDAVKDGDTYTGPAGSPMEGLTIQTQETQNGSYGTVTLTLGVGAQLSRELDFLTDPYTGSIHYQERGLQNIIDDIDDRILDMEDRMDIIEGRYMRQFAALEALLGQMQVQSDWLSNQIVGLYSF